MNLKSQRQSDCCPLCQSSILRFEGDQFCVKCDWNTMFADVQSGRFERRLGLTTHPKRGLQPSIIPLDLSGSENVREILMVVPFS